MISVSAFDLEQFQTYGYQVLTDVIDRRVVESVGSFLESQLTNALDELRKRFEFSDFRQFAEQVGAVEMHGHLTELPAELSKTITGHFPLQVRLSPVLWGVPKSRELQERLSRLFPGQSLRVHMPPTARFVLPGNHFAAVPAHQDIAYNRHLEDFVTVWVPLVEIDEKCGGVAFYSDGNIKHDLGNAEKLGFWRGPVSGIKGTQIPVKVPLGGVLLFNKWVVHESMPNHSDRIRLSVDYRFFGSHSQSTKHFLDLSRLTVINPLDKATGGVARSARGGIVP